MASTSNLRALDAAIESTPIIDNHAHPLLKPAHLSQYPLLSIATEAHGDAMEDSRSSLAHIRATKQLAQILGCDPTWDAVVAAVERKRAASSSEAWTRRCLRGIETILVDDGLDGAERVETYSWHDRFTQSKCKRIVRIEAVAGSIIARHLKSPEARGSLLGRSILEDFTSEIKRSIEDPEVVGFKSIICYRGGLDIAQAALPIDAVIGILEEIANGHRQGIKLFERLQHQPLNQFFVHETAQLIRDTQTPYKKPIQFHTGLGDNDITLTKSSPSHLQTFVREYPTVPVVILHAGYPWMKEAAYLAALYSHVYVDIGEVFPFVSRHGQENVIQEILELCPWSKVLWSTDGHWFPETYLLATTQVRSVLKTVLGDLVRTGQLDEKQAVQLVQDILFNNSNKLYNLRVESSIPSFSQLSQTRPGSLVESTIWTPDSVLQKLRSFNARWLRVYWHDYTSSARCRLVPMKQVYRTLESGKPLALSITKAALGLLQLDMMISEINATGAYLFHPDWSSLKSGPVDGQLSCYGEFRNLDGSEEILCPRTLLRRTLERARALPQGLDFLIGFEIEFLVVERNPNPNSGGGGSGSDKYRPLRSSDGHAWSMARAVADWGAEQGSFATAMDEVLDALDAADIEVELFHPESAPGQYELVLAARPPLEACDSLLHARQVLEAAAARRGMRITLHPKPFAAACGSASHMHMSVKSASSPSGDGPDVYEPFYAGILKHLRALLAFTYASPASYERMVDSFWAGGRWVAWGTQNKEAPLRKCDGAHWELKVVDGLANPYFAVAAVLAAGALGGIAAGEPLTWGDCAPDPAKMSDAERGALGIEEMFPADLRKALGALTEDRELVRLLGERFVERYVDVKRAELALLEPMGLEERRRWIMERY